VLNAAVRPCGPGSAELPPTLRPTIQNWAAKLGCEGRIRTGPDAGSVKNRYSIRLSQGPCTVPAAELGRRARAARKQTSKAPEISSALCAVHHDFSLAVSDLSVAGLTKPYSQATTRSEKNAATTHAKAIP